MNHKTTNRPWETGKTTTFADVDMWEAISTSKEVRPNFEPTYLIYNKSSKNVAFLDNSGLLHIIRDDRNSYPTGMKFKASTELKQAVRYAYFLLQKQGNGKQKG